MKLHKAIIVIFGLCIILAACSSQNNDGENKEIHQKAEQNIKIQSKSLIKEENGISLDISYPVISGMANADEEKRVNQKFLDLAKEIEKQGRTEEKNLKEAGSIEHASASLTFQVFLNTERLISMNLYSGIYNGGVSILSQKPFNYDLQDNKELTITDLFENNKIPEKELIELLNKSLKEEYGYALKSAVKEIKKEQPFYITGEEIVFVFNKYELTIGAAGIPEMKIPKSKIPNLKSIYQ